MTSSKGAKMSNHRDPDNGEEVREEVLEPGEGDVDLDHLRNMVFGQELLLEEIVTHVLNNQLEDKVNLRLVNKSWLKAVSKCCRRRYTPLFHFEIKECTENGEEVSGAKSCIEFLNQLEESFTYSQLDDKMPPLQLAFQDRLFFTKENHKIFSEILHRTTGSLVELSLSIPADGGTMPFIFPNLVLSDLWIISVRIIDITTTTPGCLGYGNVTYLLQCLFNACENLRHVELYSMPGDPLYKMPPGSRFLAIPETVTMLELNFALHSEDMDILMRNSLPWLNHLDLYIVDRAITADDISKILIKFRKRLETVILDFNASRQPVDTLELYLPYLEKLTDLNVASDKMDLGWNEQLDQKLPKLETLELLGLSIPNLRKWVIGRKFNSVETLKLSHKCSDEEVVAANPGLDAQEEVVLGPNTMRLVHEAFPNMTIIELSLDGPNLLGLSTLFEKMVKLESLTLLIRNTSAYEDSTFWDALLTCLTSQQIAKWKENPEVVFPEEKNLPGIRNLSVLYDLSLNTIENDQTQPRDESLISDVVFELAFLKMSELKTLALGGRFKISSEMMEKWEKLDRCLELLEP